MKEIVKIAHQEELKMCHKDLVLFTTRIVFVEAIGRYCHQMETNAGLAGLLQKLKIIIQSAELIDVKEMLLLHMTEHVKFAHQVTWQTIGEETV